MSGRTCSWFRRKHDFYDAVQIANDKEEGKIFQELVLVIGRRGTKSTMASCISARERQGASFDINFIHSSR
jgi:phage terminase large subunit-like protein